MNLGGGMGGGHFHNPAEVSALDSSQGACFAEAKQREDVTEAFSQ